MKLYYKGKYDLNPESLPHGVHQPGAVPFNEVKDSKSLGLMANIMGAIVFVLLGTVLYLRSGNAFFSIQLSLGCLFASLLFIPHELLHAICFKEDVCLYTNLKHGLLFVVGPESMSKNRFILMCMLPNILFGFIPFTIAMLYPSLVFWGAFGTLSIAMGVGDYYNVFNAITQMPKGARTYLYQFNSFWYMPT